MGLRRRYVELKGKVLVSVANRTFKSDPSLVDRMAFRAAEVLFGRSEELDESFRHDDREQRGAATPTKRPAPH